MDNLRNRKDLLSTHVVIHKIIVSLGQRYGGIRGANTLVPPQGLGVLWGGPNNTPLTVNSVMYSHWREDPELGDFSHSEKVRLQGLLG